jgi:hypothetical protein
LEYSNWPITRQEVEQVEKQIELAERFLQQSEDLREYYKEKRGRKLLEEAKRENKEEEDDYTKDKEDKEDKEDKSNKEAMPKEEKSKKLHKGDRQVMTKIEIN